MRQERKSHRSTFPITFESVIAYKYKGETVGETGKERLEERIRNENQAYQRNRGINMNI